LAWNRIKGLTSASTLTTERGLGRGLRLGRPGGATGSAPSAWGYAGEYQEGQTGLIYLRARWYDPATGRFLTRDPFAGIPTVPATLNPYVYALNNPVMYTDPSGEVIPLLALLALGLAGGALGGVGYYGIETVANANPCTGPEWNWNQAAFWGTIGAPIGAAVALTGYAAWMGGAYLGWWGTASTGSAGASIAGYLCADGDCTNEVGYGVRLSDHAIERMAGRDVGINQVRQMIAQITPFNYYHQGEWKLGYYDPVNRIFVGRVGDVITTVIADVKPQYIENLKVAKP